MGKGLERGTLRPDGPSSGHGESIPFGDLPIDRMLAIVGEVVRLRRPTTASEIAERLSLPVPTVHRIVRQLLDRAVLKRQVGTTRVLAGPRLVALSAEVLETVMVADEPHRILTHLASELGENCHIGIMAEGEVLYIDSVRSTRTHGLQFEPGRRSPLYCTSIGKIWLAQMSPEHFRRWLNDAPLVQLTPKTIVDPEALASIIADVRVRGWALSAEELAEGVVGCAVPIHTESGRLVAAVGISVPRARMDPSDLEALVPRLREAAKDISKAIDEPVREAHGEG